MQRVISWLIARPVRTVVVLVIVFGIAWFIRGAAPQTTATPAEPTLPNVTLITPSDYVGGKSISLIGNVRATSEAKVTTERAGRVTGVNVALGQEVRAGAIVATLENASEQASVLQAEGAYDAAIAGAAQTGQGVTEANTALTAAKRRAVATTQTAYNTTNGVVLNSIDQFFANPNGTVPGLRIDGRGYTASLNTDRVDYQTLLPTWEVRSNETTIDSNLPEELTYARTNVQRTIGLLDTFLFLFEDQSKNGRYSEAELQGFRTSFTNLRASLIGVTQEIDAAIAGIESAEDAVSRAELAASGSAVSTADAQVKQALGALRAAQANLAKTILRTPISGTVSKVDIRPGDFVGSFVTVIEITNASSKEIVTYVSEADRQDLPVGTEVTIDGKEAGFVSAVSPSVDNTTGKIEVRIATDAASVVTGDTVRISKEVAGDNMTDTTVRVPLTAVKFQSNDGFVYTVENNVLVERPVMLGAIRSDTVTITEGLDLNEAIVSDARGLSAGSEVTVTN
jgi:multidrug efflux pump subunit AcrA (membrane-fusion protein)